MVVERREVHPRLIVLRVAPVGWTLPEFEPGQYVAVGLLGAARRSPIAEAEAEPPPPDKLLWRAYSIASSSRAREYVELYANLVDSGQLTPRLFALEPGDRLFLKPAIKGRFTLDEVPPGAHLALIATGTGLAPYMSMLRSALDCSGPRRVAVLLGARHARDLGYHDELLALARRCPGFSYHAIISRPEEETTVWSGPVGYVQDLWRAGRVTHAFGTAPTPSNTHVFLCGNPEMIAEMTGLLRDQGFVEHYRHQPGQIHVELYW
jgi:ferredoxin--NADP+ reductase